MGIQDIISELGGQQAAIDQIHKLFGGHGIQGIVTQMTNAGMGQQVQSWIGMSDNLPVSGQQLQQAMDPAVLQQMAQSTGLPPAQIADQVAQVLPQIVDQATPDGEVPVGPSAMSSSASMPGSSAPGSSPSGASMPGSSAPGSSSPGTTTRSAGPNAGAGGSSKSTYDR